MINNKALIIVLNWNDWNNTIKCYQSITKSLFSNYDLLIIDNGSKPYFYKKLEDYFKNFIKFKKVYKETQQILQLRNNFKKNVFLFKLHKNHGLTKGINFGFKFAIKNRYKYVLRVDNDIILTPNCLKNLFNTFRDKKVVAVSPKILHWYRKKVVWYKGFKKKWYFLMFNRTMNLKKKVVYDSKNFFKIIEVDAIAGALSLYKVDALKKSGLGDEDFFYGPEDIELSHRLKNYGKLICNMNAVAFHKIATSEKYEQNHKRIYYNIYGFMLLIKKIGNIYEKFIGYSFFVLRLVLYIFLRKKNKDLIKGHKFAVKKFFSLTFFK